ncbi:potassium transporter TrkA [Nordella sp. HKS 07]|uniref:cation:proton antiporter domain-containing protein n=1 Tax=Nordella sp. HKS 07 TaxID=2712222 RepID=UPI0013E1509A|nr:cation:proton antiporter [Nordella sp. HKS 07]QIG51780.1 potassium transporter TrkA [Nordella sp. HKS 07]
MATPLDPSAYKEALIFLGTAGVVIPIFRKLGMSSILGFLIVGTLIGPHMLGELAHTYPWLANFVFTESEQFAQLAELGVVFLLFLIGIELSFERLLTMRRLVFGLGGLQMLVTTIVLTFIGLWLGLEPAGALIVGSVLSLSSTAMVMQLLSDEKRFATHTGRASFSVLLFQDLAVIPILLLVNVLGADQTSFTFADILTAIAQALIAITIIIVIGRFLMRPLLRLVAATHSGDLFMATTLLIAVGAGYAASLAGLSMALGAFLAGLLLAETEFRREIEAIIEPFKGLLLGVFFLLVGMNIDLTQIYGYPLVFILSAVALIVIKAVIVWIIAGLFSIERHARLETALLMGPGGEFAFVVMAVALAGGVVTQIVSDALLIIVSLSMASIPLLNYLSRPLAKRILEAAPKIPMEAPPEGTEARVIIAGFGRVGRLIGAMLEEHKIPYIAVDSDPAVVAGERKLGKPIYYGDAARPEFLRRCNIADIQVIAVTMDQPKKVEDVTIAARAERADVKIIARARDDRHAVKLYGYGVTEAVPETIEASLQLGESVLVEAGVAMGLAIASVHEQRDVFRKMLGRPNRKEELALLRRRKTRGISRASEETWRAAAPEEPQGVPQDK